MEDIKYRPAALEDVPALVELEDSCFEYDRLTEKNFRHIIKKGNADVIVQFNGKQLSGYGAIFYRKGTSLARLYSIAVSPNYQGQGLGQKLLAKLEKVAHDNNMTYLRLEVKSENKAARELYEKRGYIQFTIKHDYYDDHSDAICLEKKIQKIGAEAIKIKLPFYKQTTDFTCGPASLLMAMKGLEPDRKNERLEEIQIWREATTIFMTSGHGGCGPHGLALAAHKRGFRPELYLNTEETLFVDGVRQKEKKEIIKLSQDAFEKEIKANRIQMRFDLDWSSLEDIVKRGGVPLVLISSYRLTNSKVPHWVAVSGISNDFVFFSDPYIEEGDTMVSNTNVPVRKDEFEKMAKYGGKQIKSILAVFKE